MKRRRGKVNRRRHRTYGAGTPRSNSRVANGNGRVANANGRVANATRRVAHDGGGMLNTLERPKPGRVYFPDQAIDGLIEFVTENLTRSKLKTLLLTADHGELAEALTLFEEMEATWPDLKCAAVTRRKALTGLPWEVVSAGEVEELKDRQLADKAAEFVKSEFTKLISLDRGLVHLGKAVTDNLSVVDLVWEDNRIVELNVVPVNRLRMDTQTPGVVRVVTADNATGHATTGTGSILGKWVVHIPEGMPDRPLLPALARTATMVYLIAQVCLLNWARFTEIFGMPVRIGRYRQNATADEKNEMHKMLDGMGSRAWALVSEAVELTLVESSQRGTAPYETLLAYCARAVGKLYTGGNLIGDNTGATGSLAAATVQDNVRGDLRDDDIKNEGDMVRCQIIAPMCYFKFWKQVPLPYFRRVKPETDDRSDTGDIIIKGQTAGMKVPKKWAHERLGIPEPKPGEEVLTPQIDPFGEGVDPTGGLGA